MSRALALDFGRRRIGVAVTDPTRTIATPLKTLDRVAGRRPPWAEIMRIIEQQEATDVVIGLPLGLDGEEGAWAREVREFGAQIERRSGRTVHWVDERLTSVRAERTIRSLGLKRKDREDKARVDAAAAALILEGWLARQRYMTDH